MRPGLLSSICDTFGLGSSIAEPVRVTGGLLNTMWQVNTSSGVFAVKVLSDNDGSPTLHFDYNAAHRLEVAARSAGILAPEPVIAVESKTPVACLPERVVVHKWVQAEPCPKGSLTVGSAKTVGEILATVHGLGLPVRTDREDGYFPGADDWKSIAARGSALGRPWALAMLEMTDSLSAISALIGQLSKKTHPEVFAHTDINHKNILRDGDAIYVVDWESATDIDVNYNLGATAMEIAAGDFDRLTAFLRGYAEVEGSLPEVDGTWLTTWLAHPTYFLWFTLRRSLEPQGDDEGTQLRSNEVIANSLIELNNALAKFDSHTETLRKAAATVTR